MKNLKIEKLIALLLLSVLVVCFTACGNTSTSSEPTSSGNTTASENSETTASAEEEMNQFDTKNPIVALEIETYGTVYCELYPDVAPNTVNNFISLVKSGFYNNNKIVRVQSDFVIQGGDPTGTGSGGPGYSIVGEFSANGYNNTLSHTAGVLSMARSSDYNSAGSQFFIMISDYTGLDGSYAGFGKVIEGMDVVSAINTALGSTNNMGFLSNPIQIVKATVDLKEYADSYKEPEKIVG